MDLEGAEWLQWKRQDKTKDFVAFLEGRVLDIQGEWLNKSYVSEDRDRGDTLNTVALATARAYMSVIEEISKITEPEVETGGEENAERVGP